MPRWEVLVLISELPEEQIPTLSFQPFSSFLELSVPGKAVEHLGRSRKVEKMENGEKGLLNYSAASIIGLKSRRLITFYISSL